MLTIRNVNPGEYSYSGEVELNHMDHEGEFLDEINNKRLERQEAFPARLGEIKRLYSHDVFEKAPLEQCWQVIGKTSKGEVD